MPRSIKDWSPRETPVKVIFRKYPDDDIVAIFPELPSTPNPATCLVYAHVGQHGTGDCRLMMRSTLPAAPKEYEVLKKELEARGYWLEVKKRITSSMVETRRREFKGDL